MSTPSSLWGGSSQTWWYLDPVGWKNGRNKCKMKIGLPYTKSPCLHFPFSTLPPHAIHPFELENLVVSIPGPLLAPHQGPGERWKKCGPARERRGRYLAAKKNWPERPYLADHPRTRNWLITMVGKSPKQGCSPYTWPQYKWGLLSTY